MLQSHEELTFQPQGTAWAAKSQCTLEPDYLLLCPSKMTKLSKRGPTTADVFSSLSNLPVKALKQL